MTRLDEEITGRLARLAASEGLELLAVEMAGTARRPTVRLVLDREGGITLGDCENVSRQASALLDAHDPFPGPFTLEVSSPGLDRKLYRDNDYVRFTGRAVKVRMRPTWRANRAVEGVLEGKEGGVVRVRDRRETVHELPEHEVFEVRLAPFSEEPPPTKKHSTERGKR